MLYNIETDMRYRISYLRRTSTKTIDFSPNKKNSSRRIISQSRRCDFLLVKITYFKNSYKTITTTRLRLKTLIRGFYEGAVWQVIGRNIPVNMPNTTNEFEMTFKYRTSIQEYSYELRFLANASPIENGTTNFREISTWKKLPALLIIP